MTFEESDVICRKCGKAQESITHVLPSCSALAQTKYLSRHNRALKILFFELLKDHLLIEAVPPWYSPTQPKPLYQNEQVAAYWDIPVCADHTEMRANRVDVKIVDKERMTVTLLEIAALGLRTGSRRTRRKPASTPPYDGKSRRSTRATRSLKSTL